MTTTSPQSQTQPEKLPGEKPALDPLSLAYQVEGISPWRQDLSRRGVRFFMGFWGFVADHWLFILNTVNAFCLVAGVTAPALAALGWDGPANALYTLFGYVCVQNPHHSFYIAGRQMCICQRCSAIYGGMLLAGLLFYLVRTRLKALRFWQFVLFCLPIAVDGFTQLFGWRESTPELRLFTGGLFAVGLVWSLYPTMYAKMKLLRLWTARELNA